MRKAVARIPEDGVLVMTQIRQDQGRTYVGPAGREDSIAKVSAAPLVGTAKPAFRILKGGRFRLRNRAEVKLRLALDPAGEAQAMKNLFIANMSHALRTPMNGVLGLLQVLLGTAEEPARLLLRFARHLAGGRGAVRRDWRGARWNGGPENFFPKGGCE